MVGNFHIKSCLSIQQQDESNSEQTQNHAVNRSPSSQPVQSRYYYLVAPICARNKELHVYLAALQYSNCSSRNNAIITIYNVDKYIVCLW